VHDTLERCSWEVEVADAQRVKGLAPLACKTDRIDAWVLAELSRRELVPAIWLPSFALRAERERACWRLFLVGKRSSRTQRVHAQLLAFGHTCPVSDLFGAKGRELLGRLEFPRAVALRRAGRGRDDRRPRPRDRHRRSRAQTVGRRSRLGAAVYDRPGNRWVLGYTIAAEIGEIRRFASPKKLCGYTGLCQAVYQSGGKDRRGHLTHAGPR
jgi:transposase